MKRNAARSHLILELHNKLKLKEREMECLLNKLSEKDELLRQYGCQIEELKKDIKCKGRKYQEVLKQLKGLHNEGNTTYETSNQEDSCESADIGEIVRIILKKAEDEKKCVEQRLQNAECQLKALTADKKKYVKERNEIKKQLQDLLIENERLLKEVTSQKKIDCEKEELLKTIDILNSDKKELCEKVSSLHENIKELNNSFQDTRWALTSEVAEKHDQVQDLKRCVGVLEDKLRQADMQTHFKDDIIKEMRKELKAYRKSDRIEFYDVVNELKERKKEDAYDSKCSNSGDMKKNQSGGESNYQSCATITITDKSSQGEDRKGGNENEKFLSQIECLKNSLKAKIEELRCQEDFTRSLAEELANTKMNVCILERQNKLDMNFESEYDLKRHHAKLLCAVDNIEEMMRELLSQQNCDFSQCRNSLEKEMEVINLIKIELQKGKSKQPIRSNSLEFSQPFSSADTQCSQCNLVHVKDVEKFKEIALTGAVALEQMKEQIDFMESLSKNRQQERSSVHVNGEIEEKLGKCEEKLEKLREEFNDVTFQLCQIIQKFNKQSFVQGSCYSVSFDESNSNDTISEIFTPDKNKVTNDQKPENTTERLKIMSKQLEEEIHKKRNQLEEHTRELDSKVNEISKLRELIRKVCNRLKDAQNEEKRTPEQYPKDCSPKTNNLSCLFYDLQEFWSILEKSMANLFKSPKNLVDDNEKLKEKLGCLEKCVSNKEETLRHLQDTVKLRECQIEDLKCKVQNAESRNCKLVKDVEEKCRLIASLQEAVRKGKQLELNMELIESLRFEFCELECRLEKYEKEILQRDQKLERLHNEITNLTAKNFILSEKLKIIDPKLKILYKTSHLFEKTVCDLEAEINTKDNEIESLYQKVKDLEADLEKEFKKCESKSVEDAKYIDELNMKIKNLQYELYNSQKSENETENRFKKEHDMNRTPGVFNHTDFQFYEKRVLELQRALEYIAREHEEERKNIYEKLCEEKKENVKNKTLITKLNENMKRKMQTERTLKESIDNLTEELGNLKDENQELKTEIEARKKVMNALEKEDDSNLVALEELICCLKLQKTELKIRCCNLKAEVEKEVKLKRLSECRVEDLNSMLEKEIQKFNHVVENYKCTSSRLQKTYETMKEIEDRLISSESDICDGFSKDSVLPENCLKKLLAIKTAENAKLICQIEVMKVQIESIQTENTAEQDKKDVIISQLQNETEILEMSADKLNSAIQKLEEENQKLLKEVESWSMKGADMENEFRDQQKDLCEKLRITMCEKNDLLNSLDELQKQLEIICLENVNQEKLNQELSEENSRLKLDKSSDDNHLRSKTDKIISNLTKEVKSLHLELSKLKESYSILQEEYQVLLDQLKCTEKKKSNIDKLYAEVNCENQKLLETKAIYERELCELRTHNSLLKDKYASIGELNPENKNNLSEKVKELNQKIKTLEKKVIPQMEATIAEKTCAMDNLKMELQEANVCNQKMRNEASRMIEQTRKYLAAQRFANENLKTRLECSNKRGNILGIENRELEEQLKAVTRMNEYLLCQLEIGKNNFGETEPRSYSPLPWGCSTVERDTSSSEYLAESGFQSMQPSPTIMDCDHESQYESKRNCFQWNSLKKNKCGGSVEFSSHRSNIR